MVRNGDPFGAIPLFDEAEKAGAVDTALAGDRGLAYDLVGDNVTAQRFYRQSLALVPNEEVTRRLALSLAIAGDQRNAELILSPLLQQRNPAAWRTRAFVLAIVGQTEEAVGIANTILPADLAASVAPYLRYMPRLTHAQQAAAANFGIFPRASEIGRDDPRVAQYAPQRLASVDAALTPQGEPLGRKSRGRDKNRSSRTAGVAAASAPTAASADRIAPPEPLPTREVAIVLPPPPAPAAVPARSAALTPTAPAAAHAAVAPPARTAAMAPTHPPVPAPTPAPAAPRTTPSMLAVSPGFSIASAAPTQSRPAASPPPAAPASPPPAAPASPPPAPPVARPAPVSASVTVAPTPAPKPAPKPAAPAPRSLSDAFADFAVPSTDATPAAGAVDLRRIKPAAAAPKKPVEPPPPSHPSRIWVQVATGRDKAALGFDWRRMTREKADALRGKTAYVSAWGQTNRLLTGPFQSEAAANSFIAQLRKADVDGAFVWISPAGQVVDALGSAPTTPAKR